MKNEKAEHKLHKMRQIKEPYNIYIGGIELVVYPQVYPTSELSELVCECMDDPLFGITAGDKVLDYGTGTGFLAIQAALRGAETVALDINPCAIQCAKKNASLHGVIDKITFRQSDGVSSLYSEEKFNIILAGLPWDCGIAEDMVALSMYDPEFNMRRSLFDNVSSILEDNGRIFMTYAQFIQERYPIDQFNKSLNYHIVKNRLINGDLHYAYLINGSDKIFDNSLTKARIS
jgi:16S rRNA G1207 methylase RsmC